MLIFYVVVEGFDTGFNEVERDGTKIALINAISNFLKTN